MTDRKLLILTYHFPPSAASGTYRTLGFARHLPQFCWRCVVVSPPGLHWEPVDEGLLGQVPPETAVYRVPYPIHRFWKPVRKLYPWGAWLPFAARGCYRAIREQQPDAILTSGPPHGIHLLGRHLRRKTGLPWLADFRDPWVAGDRSPLGSARWWEAGAERRVMRDANVIVANTPASCELLQQAYPQHAAKMMSITNGYDPERFELNSTPPLSGSNIEIVHTGMIYANRSPGVFLDAIRRLEPRVLGGRSARVRLIGGFMFKEAEEEIDRKSRERGHDVAVVRESHVPYLQSIQAMAQADILLLLDSPGRRVGVPAKLYEYIGACRPILALAEPDSDVAWVLRESGTTYRIAPPLDVEAIRTAFVELIEDPATRFCAERRQAAQSRFTRENVAGEMAAVLDSVTPLSSFKAGDRRLPEVAR